MTQTNDPSRLDRIEALILELATTSLRHETAIVRRDEELNRINATLDRVSENQNANAEQIAHLTAGLAELRKLVSDYIQGRSQIQEQ